MNFVILKPFGANFAGRNPGHSRWSRGALFVSEGKPFKYGCRRDRWGNGSRNTVMLPGKGNRCSTAKSGCYGLWIMERWGSSLHDGEWGEDNRKIMMHTLIGSTVVYCRCSCAIHWRSCRLNRFWVSQIADESIRSAQKGHDRFRSNVWSPQFRIVFYFDSFLSLLAHSHVSIIFPSLWRVKKLWESGRTDLMGS